jgi:hypothetical protein
MLQHSKNMGYDSLKEPAKGSKLHPYLPMTVQVPNLLDHVTKIAHAQLPWPIADPSLLRRLHKN